MVIATQSYGRKPVNEVVRDSGQATLVPENAAAETSPE